MKASLNETQVNELNELLSDHKLDIPAFRRSVSTSGRNIDWLQRNIQIRNKKLHPRIIELLDLEIAVNS